MQGNIHRLPAHAARPVPGGARSEAPAFVIEDARAIQSEVNGVAAIAPTASKPVQAISGSRNWSTAVTGSTAAFLVVLMVYYLVSTVRQQRQMEERIHRLGRAPRRPADSGRQAQARF